MKKQIILLFALATSFAALSQNKVAVGVKAGINNSSFKGDAAKSLNGILENTNGIVTTQGKTAFFGGLYADIPLGGNFSFEPGVQYAQKGYDIKGSYDIKNLDFLALNAKASLISNYIDMPVLLKANIEGLQIFAGPQFSYLVNSNLRTTAGALGYNILNRDIDVTDQFNRWDINATAGLGYAFNKNFAIQAAYDYGLTKPDKNKNVNANIQTLKVGLAYSF